MKKLFIVLAVIALVASFVQAQAITGVGPKVQLNLATISGDNTSDAKMGLRFGVGGFIIANLIPELDLQADVLYNQKGSNDKNNSDAKLTLSYIDIDALAKYPIPMEGDIKPTVFLGPQIGILVGATADPGGHDVKNTFESLDYGLIFGGGVTFGNIGDGSLLVDVRYNLGLSNILKIGGSVASIQNQTISLTVGYAFKP